MDRKIEYININKLGFDYDNPRLPRSYKSARSEKDIIEYMVKFGNIIELMASIAENGYFEAEPLLVVPSARGNYRVIEGNRRLAALKLLNNPSLSPLRKKSINEVIDSMEGEAPDSVPCIIYQNESEIIDYLGYRHITGVKDWGALEKARYLDRLYEQHKNDADEEDIYKKLAKMIGSRSDYVRKLHMALNLYTHANDKAYYGLDLKEKDVDFSWITTALGYSSITDYLGFRDKSLSIKELNESNFKKLFKWMFDPEKSVVKESRQISTLAKVIGAKEALKKLEEGAKLTEAVLYTTDPSEVFIKLLYDAKEKLQQATLTISQLNEEPPNTRQLLKEIYRVYNTVKGAMIVNEYSDFKESDIDSKELRKASKRVIEYLSDED